MDGIDSKFVTPDNRAWAEAAAEGRLLIGHCRGCDENHYYPRPFCPFCGSGDTGLVQASGQGIVYTFSPCRISRKPLVNAYVTLREGPTIMTKIMDADPETLAIGQSVLLDFEDSSMGFPVPVFRPVAKART